MSDLVLATNGLIFCSVLFNKRHLEQNEIVSICEKHFGPLVLFTHDFFPMKKYYSAQMGASEDLSRLLIVSLNPTCREELVTQKIWADQLEKNVSKDKNLRVLNLDIGLLTLENVTLATGKNFSHRIYLGLGVYSDLNLQFENKTFKSLPWTYPDYAHPDFILFFNWVRSFLHRKLHFKKEQKIT